MSVVADLELCGGKGWCREKKEGKELVAAGDWLGVIPIQIVVSTVHVVSANIAVQPFTTEQP